MTQMLLDLANESQIASEGKSDGRSWGIRPGQWQYQAQNLFSPSNKVATVVFKSLTPRQTQEHYV